MRLRTYRLPRLVDGTAAHHHATHPEHEHFCVELSGEATPELLHIQYCGPPPAGPVRLELGEADRPGTALSPSAANVAVVFDVHAP